MSRNGFSKHHSPNAIGYQDNRTQDIVVYVSNGMGAEEVVGVLQDALDGSRSGSGPRRY